MIDLSKYEYADIREITENTVIVRIKDEEIRVSSGKSFGIGVRVLKNGSWGFASGGNVEELLKKAEKLAAISKGDIELAKTESKKDSIEKKIKEASLEEKVETIIDAKKEMEKEYIKNRTFRLSETNLKVRFYSSEGTEIVEQKNYVYFSAQAIGKNDSIQVAHERQASVEGFSRINCYEVSKKAQEKLGRILKAKLPPRGKFTVIMNPEMTGVFSHEAVGHACEGDTIVHNDSILKDKIGEKIASELVSIVDDPTANDFGHYIYDDEGITAEKTTLIEKGVLKNYLLSRQTAKKLKLKPNGHARADSHSSSPIVRMSNTYFMAGKSKREEVFDIKNGIYLVGMKGGSVDTFIGGFMFKAEEDFRIKNGQIEENLRDVTIIGNVVETMKNVEIVGNDFATSPGICGKSGQQAPVSDGGPHIRVKNLTIG